MTEPTLSFGKPSDQTPASFTRFVLPFAYQIENDTDDSALLRYKRICTCRPETIASEQHKEKCRDPNCAGTGLNGIHPRRKYLTTETADMLFQRAHWYQLSQDNGRFWLNNYVPLSSGHKNIELSEVFLVLFEFPDSPDAKSPPDLFQTGFLVFETHFKDESSLNDLIKFNEIFRYTEEPFTGHSGRDSVKEFHSSRFLKSVSEPAASASTFSGAPYEWWQNYLKFPIETRHQGVPVQVRLVTGYPKSEDSDLDQRSVLPDNRAFVWTCAILKNRQGARSLALNRKDVGLTDSNQCGYWVRLLNVDGTSGLEEGGTVPCTDFEKTWLKERTYQRWSASGTYYGFTSHSGALLGSPCDDPPTHMHFRQMYFDQALILLYVRVSLFRFSAKLNRISADARRAANGEKKWAEDFRKLRWDLTLFTNLYQFPLLSNQQQAVEMYEIARKQMDIEILFEEVQEEIHNSYEYLEQLEASLQTKEAGRLTAETMSLSQEATTLTRIATFALPIGILLGLFGAGPEWFDALSTLPYAFTMGDKSWKLIYFFSYSILGGMILGLGLMGLVRVVRWLSKKFQ